MEKSLSKEHVIASEGKTDQIWFKNLQKVREGKKMTQVKLATETELSQQSITYYETGQRNCSIEAAAKIAETLNTSIDYLIGSNARLMQFYELSPQDQEAVLLMIDSLKRKNN